MGDWIRGCMHAYTDGEKCVCARACAKNQTFAKLILHNKMACQKA